MLTIKHTESVRNGLFEAWLDDVHVGEPMRVRCSRVRMNIRMYYSISAIFSR